MTTPAAKSSAGAAAPVSLKYSRFWTVAALVFACDQASKAWISARLPYDTFGPLGAFGQSSGAIPVIPGFWYLVNVGNTGAAWSLFTGDSLALGVLAAATLVAIYWWRRSLALHTPWSQLCFGLLCGGIAGNLTDRIARGHVVDFIDLHFGRYVYPTFNVADSAICVGVFLYLLSTFRRAESS